MLVPLGSLRSRTDRGEVNAVPRAAIGHAAPAGERGAGPSGGKWSSVGVRRLWGTSAGAAVQSLSPALAATTCPAVWQALSPREKYVSKGVKGKGGNENAKVESSWDIWVFSQNVGVLL